MKVFNALFVLILIGGTFVFAQDARHQKHRIWRVSEAYTILVREKARAAGDLYEAEQTRGENTPQVQTARFRFALLNREIAKLSRTNSRIADKFTAAYGDLILAKIQTETELFNLRQKFTPEYVAVKKKQIELASLNADIGKINRSLH